MTKRSNRAKRSIRYSSPGAAEFVARPQKFSLERKGSLSPPLAARRTLTTAEIITKKLDYKLKGMVVDDRLSAGEADDLLNVIHKLRDKLECVMLFGHNPQEEAMETVLRCLWGTHRCRWRRLYPGNGGGRRFALRFSWIVERHFSGLGFADI